METANRRVKHVETKKLLNGEKCDPYLSDYYIVKMFPTFSYTSMLYGSTGILDKTNPDRIQTCGMSSRFSWFSELRFFVVVSVRGCVWGQDLEIPKPLPFFKILLFGNTDFGKLYVWSCGILEYGKVENFEILESWNLGILKRWNFEFSIFGILKSCNFEISKLWNFGSLNFG